MSEALDSSGNVTAQQLYIPYGGSRYYDPVLGQFASADAAQDGLNRYGYVHGNPTTVTDPSGHGAGQCIIDNGVQYCPGSGGGGGCTHNCGGGNPPGGDGDGGGDGRNHATCRGNANAALRPECKAWYLWAYGLTDSTSGCDPSNTGALCIRERALSDLKMSALPWILGYIVADVLAFAAALAGKVTILAVLSGAMFFLESLVNAFGWLSNISPAFAEQYLPLASSAASMLGVVSSFLGVVSGLASWQLWTIQGTYLVVKFGLEGLAGSLVKMLFAAAISLVLDGVGAFFEAKAASIFAGATVQANMPIWDWCGPNGPGAGQCSAEPNGGMPIF